MLYQSKLMSVLPKKSRHWVRRQQKTYFTSLYRIIPVVPKAKPQKKYLVLITSAASMAFTDTQPEAFVYAAFERKRFIQENVRALIKLVML